MTETHILWHERYGLEKLIPVSPQILLAIKQIDTDATPILYENNVLKIDMSSPVLDTPTGGVPSGIDRLGTCSVPIGRSAILMAQETPTLIFCDEYRILKSNFRQKPSGKAREMVFLLA